MYCDFKANETKCGNEKCMKILVINLQSNFGDLTLFGECMQHQKRFSGFFFCVATS
jgi:hypothetical protein